MAATCYKRRLHETTHYMAKKSSSNRPHKSSKPAKLPPLTDIQQQVVTYVINSVAFDNYGDCCSVDTVAEKLKRTANRFMPTLRKLVEKGYLTIQGETLPWVYPTVAALRKQDPNLSEAEAEKILARIGK